jgi:hypothetical protein
MAMKWGNCQTNRIANSATPGHSITPRAAVQPISGGSAPGNAPMNVLMVLTCFSGV